MDVNELLTRKDLFEVEERISKKLDQLKNQDYGTMKWLRTSDVSKMLGLSPSSIQSLRISGILPFSKVNGTLFYKPKDVEEMVNEGSTKVKSFIKVKF